MSNASTAPAEPARPSDAKKPARGRRALRTLWRTTVGLFAVIGVFSVLRPFVFELTPMTSGSMSPTLQGENTRGDWVLVDKVTYHFRLPQRWEIVEFHNADGLQIMKRVVAFKGETVAVSDHQLQVNGDNLSPPIAGGAKYYAYGNLSGGRAHLAGDGYYVLGDDSADSEDSRFVGSVKAQQVSGRALFIVWPPSRMGWVR